MPNIRTHDNITTIGTLLSLPIALQITHNLELSAIASSSFYFAGYMFGPDLDMAHSRPSKRWGKFKFLWRGYRKYIATHHRHPLSHYPLLGTVARVLYLGMVVFIISTTLFLLGKSLSFAWATEASKVVWRLQDWNPLEDYRVWCCAIGLEVGAASHYIPDYLSSWVKAWRE